MTQEEGIRELLGIPKNSMFLVGVFETGKWYKPHVDVLKNVQGFPHGAEYLNGIDIIVFWTGEEVASCPDYRPSLSKEKKEKV